MKYFDENILALINMLQYDMWLIIPNEKIDCVCKDFNTKQGEVNCPYCLGTGHKVKVKKIKGVRQPITQSASGMQLTVEVGVYFFTNDYKLKENDFIIWHDEIEQITKVERFCSDAQKPVYYRCETKKKKSNNDMFLANFYKSIEKTK